ncbi:MAG: DUF4349 domain-containing protein, partial [Sphingobacteriales bacterium]
DEQIGQRLEQRAIDDAVRFSTVRVELEQPPVLRREVRVNDNLDAYTPAFSTRLGEALGRGWELFSGLLIALAHLWVFLLAGVAGWAALRYWGKGRARVQPAK